MRSSLALRRRCDAVSKAFLEPTTGFGASVTAPGLSARHVDFAKWPSASENILFLEPSYPTAQLENWDLHEAARLQEKIRDPYTDRMKAKSNMPGKHTALVTDCYACEVRFRSRVLSSWALKSLKLPLPAGRKS